MEEKDESYETDVLNPYTFQIQYQVRLLYNLDNYNKLKMVLNVYRSVQKRITIDYQRIMQIENGCAGTRLDTLNPTLFEDKLKHNKMGSINPVLPMFEIRSHTVITATNTHSPTVMEYFKNNFLNLHKRKDVFRFDEVRDEYIVYDELGYEILQDCAITDFDELIKHLVQIATFQIYQFEAGCMKDLEIFNNENQNDDKPFIPIVDRTAILSDLLEHEYNYQVAKLD